MMSTEMLGTCQSVMSDLQNQYKEVKITQLFGYKFYSDNNFSARMQDMKFRKMS